jgi:hypothetical protein
MGNALDRLCSTAQRLTKLVQRTPRLSTTGGSDSGEDEGCGGPRIVSLVYFCFTTSHGLGPTRSTWQTELAAGFVACCCDILLSSVQRPCEVWDSQGVN